MVETTQQVIEHPQTERAIGIGHPLNAEHLKNRRHDGNTTEQNRQPVTLDARQIQGLGRTSLDQQGTEFIQPNAGYPTLAVRVQAIHFQHISDRPGCTRGANGLFPAESLVIMGNQFDLFGRRDLRLAQAIFVDLSIREKAQRIADATHVKRLHQLRIMPFANDEFRRTTTNIDHQPLVSHRGQGVRGADVDQARLFTTGNDFDGKTQGLFSLRQKLCRILGHP